MPANPRKTKNPNPVSLGNGLYQCPLCDYQHANISAVHLHINNAHFRTNWGKGVKRGQYKMTNDSPVNNDNPVNTETDTEKQCCSDQNYRFLSKHSQIEILARQQGYTMVCTNCDTLK